jgi:hypothetical protein
MRTRLRRKAWWGLAVLVALVVGDYWFYPRLAPVGGAWANKGDNGLWLRYWWYFGERSDDEVRALAALCRAHQIRFAYFHVRSIGRDGVLSYRYPASARRLISVLRAGAPDIKAIAWVYAGNARGRGSVDLSNADLRRRMVREAVWLAADCGFDGIQWDYEVCSDGDQGLLALLAETRAALPADKVLSVAAPMWMPGALQRFGWSEAYFAQVSALCDQVCVMCYDSGAYLPRAYAWLVRQQAVHVTRAVAAGSPSCQALLGVPTYGKGLRSHNPRAEDLSVALKAVRAGLADSRATKGAFSGVAVFADHTTDAAEWAAYDALWLGP